MAIASFNNEAVNYLKHNNLDDIFDTIAYGKGTGTFSVTSFFSLIMCEKK